MAIERFYARKEFLIVPQRYEDLLPVAHGGLENGKRSDVEVMLLKLRDLVFASYGSQLERYKRCMTASSSKRYTERVEIPGSLCKRRKKVAEDFHVHEFGARFALEFPGMVRNASTRG